MRESRTYGSGRGACHETHVPTATEAHHTPRVHHAARRRGGGPVAQGIFPSLARPGGNITGFTQDHSAALATKRLQLLKDAMPTITRGCDTPNR